MAESKVDSEKTCADNEDKTLKLPESTDNVVIQAPNVITWMGCLLVNSAEQDFSLTEKSDNVTEFQYIKYPDSFHACVVQVSHGIIQAFNTAHHEMNSIRMKSENIVENVEKAIQVMNESGNNKKRIKNQWVIIEPYLRDTGKECAECIEKTASITEEFERVKKTMEELLEALIRSKGKYENEQNSTNLEMETTREKQDMETKHKNELEKDCEETSNEIEDAKKNYEEAVNSFPPPWKIKLVKIFDSVTVLFSGKVSTNETVQPSTTPKISNEEANAYLAAGDILNHAKMLMSTSCDKNDIAAKVKTSLEEICSDLNVDAPQSDVIRTVKKLREDGIKICNEFNTINAEVKKFFETAKDFHEKGEVIFENLERPEPTDENKIGQNPESRLTKDYLEPPSGGNKVSIEPSTTHEITSEEAKKSSQKPEVFTNGTAEPISTPHEITDEEEKKSSQKPEREDKEGNERYETTKEMKEKKSDDMVKFHKIRDTLDSSLRSLNLLTKQWVNLQNMLEEIYNLMIKEKKIKDKKKDKASQYEMHQRVIEESKKVQKLAHVVGGISSLYCRVSKEYLLDGVARLQRIISLDPIKDCDKIVEVEQEWKNAQQKMVDEILKIAQEKREDLSKRINSL